MTLVEFLTARLDEDEELARVSSVFVDGEFRDDVRALREVEAKRRIVAEHRGTYDCEVCCHEEESSDDSEGNREWHRSGVSAPCPTLRILASVYADHPDYREEWT